LSRDLNLSPSMITFENLDDLLGTIDDSIDIHKRAIERYSDLLGGILRTTLGEGPVHYQEQPRPQSQGDQSQHGRFGLFKPQPQGSNSKRPQKGKQEEVSPGWTIIESGELSIKIATGTTSLMNTKKTEALFKIVEALKSKLTTLEIARKSLAELPSKGLRSNQILSVVFKDGIPRQIIPSNESTSQRNKFAFEADFEVEPMRVR
jgi:hypothetical protein